MKRIFVVLALLLAVGCDDQRIIIVKDGKFAQTGILTNRGATVHRSGLDVLGADRPKQYASAINFTDGTSVMIDIGRSIESAQNSLEQFNADYDISLKSLHITEPCEGRKITCVQRSTVHAGPAACGTIIQPGELSALYDTPFPATAIPYRTLNCA